MSQELEGTLTNEANLIGAFGSTGGGGTNNYNNLINKPSINGNTLSGNKTSQQLGLMPYTALAPVATSGDYDDLTNKPTIPAAQIQSDWSQSDNTQVDYIKNKPTLAPVATSGDYDDLTNKPTIPAAQVQSDWSQSDNTQVDYIKNKPTIPTNSDFALSGLSDTDITTPSANQVLAYNGSKWGNKTLKTVGDFTPKDNTVSVQNITFGKVDSICSISARINATITQNSLTNLGTIDLLPPTDLYLPCCSSGGVFLGFIQIKSTGEVGIYCIATSGTYGICFSASYIV